MNHKTYIKLIASQYGGLHKSELEVKLRKLVDLAIREQSQKSETPNQIINTSVQKPVEKQVASNPHSSSSRMGTYERAMALIRQFNNTGWKHILEVPDDLFKDFWAIAEMHLEIIFDEDRQWQYFKVEKFRVRLIDQNYERD
jgi:hypothetical protein